jgi:hypothetical protein
MNRNEIDYDAVALAASMMWQHGRLTAEIKVGRYIVGALLDGDYSKVRGGDARLRKLADRGRMKIGIIRRAVRIARLAHEWPGLREMPGLSVNHVAMVLAHPTGIARAELEKASRNGWSLREFRSRASLPKRNGQPGRPRVPEPLKAARYMARFAAKATMWENIGDLTPDERESMLSALQRVETRLSQALIELEEMRIAHESIKGAA